MKRSFRCSILAAVIALAWLPAGQAEQAQEVEELDPVQLRNLVQPEDQLVDHVGEGLDQRDSGVGHVVVGPLGSTLLKEAFRLVDEVLKGAIVQIGGWKAHYPSCSGIR